MANLRDDFEDCITIGTCAQARRPIHTTNLPERLFFEKRQRLKIDQTQIHCGII